MNSQQNDGFFVGAFACFFVACSLTVLGVLGGCFDTGEGPTLVEGPLEEEGGFYDERQPVLTDLYLEGSYLGQVEGGTTADTSQCTMIGDRLNLHLRGLDTQQPYIDNPSEVRIFCDPIDVYTNTWSIHCEEYDWCFTCFPWYWIYYDFHIDRLGWEEKEYIGWSYWTIDVLWYFWCVHTFRLDYAEPTYDWR